MGDDDALRRLLLLGLGDDPQQERLARRQDLLGVQAHRLQRAVPADEPVDRAVRMHDRRVAGVHAGGVLRAHDRRVHVRLPTLAQALCGPGECPGDHCGGAAFPCMASHTREGVHGMSMWRTP